VEQKVKSKILLREKGQNVNWRTHLHSVLRLRMVLAVPSVPHILLNPKL